MYADSLTACGGAPSLWEPFWFITHFEHISKKGPGLEKAFLNKRFVFAMLRIEKQHFKFSFFFYPPCSHILVINAPSSTPKGAGARR